MFSLIFWLTREIYCLYYRSLGTYCLHSILLDSNFRIIIHLTIERNETHQSVQNSNSNVTRWKGDVEACEVVTITIVYSGGNGIGDLTAKRGEGEEEVELGTSKAECN